MTTIADVLAEARQRLQRVDPLDAWVAVSQGALLVDIRPELHQRLEGTIPGALVIERNVLEWRLDPASDDRIAEAGSHDLPIVVFCNEGYTSSLAAAALQDLGLWRATDLVGGFRAWQAAGLPIDPPVGLAS
ncbi:rhodanese-like domain-containing protein [Acidothermaceae bacterium B102]|nr:rhodanese-like domain-containing protein [Acidothermaceae bacterium B102]